MKWAKSQSIWNLWYICYPPQNITIHCYSASLITQKKSEIQMSVSAPFVLLLLLLLQTSQAAGDGWNCKPSSCGNIPIIKQPFRLTTDPKICGDYRYELSCESNTTVLYLKRLSARYYVQEINYHNLTIRLVDDGVIKGNCSSFPITPLSVESFSSFVNQYSTWRYTHYNDEQSLGEVLILISCENPMNSSVRFTKIAPCINHASPRYYYYAVIAGYGGVDLYSLGNKCKVEMMTLLAAGKNYSQLSFQQLHQHFEYGFLLSWHRYKCTHCSGGCYVHSDYSVECSETKLDIALYGTLYVYKIILFLARKMKILVYSVAAVVIVHLAIKACGFPFGIAFLIYKWRRRHRSAYDKIEEFIQNHNLMPIRYSYSNIKKFTHGFKDKLGEGGFGSVYKCKLRSGSFAAVKILGKKSTAGGVQDFINEVATIGRIHHTNVVRLIGFCSEGSKRALVYEFMPNGSLDKYIFHKQQQGGGHATLRLEQLYRISIGVARGIEYLHSRCAMQILHFDIKPHNVLLDDNFNPKLSDFGLAKLYNAGDRVATLTAVRGTIGYMAPELFYKNIGSVSHKADVYSFGMLLLDMAEKRNNSNAEADHSSQVYFPFWVHDQVSTPGTPIAVGDNVTEEENDVAKKMVIVGLWCIQTNPESRPPMNKVLEMLEGELESLSLPPRPVLYAGESVRNYEEGSSSCFVSSSSQYTQSTGQSSGEH
ncbi:Rust resistance kinase Lr10 [Linum perenne]